MARLTPEGYAPFAATTLFCALVAAGAMWWWQGFAAAVVLLSVLGFVEMIAETFYKAMR